MEQKEYYEILPERAIEILKLLDPVFKKAAEIAVAMQSGIDSRDKLGTGNRDIDIVTEADHAVQEAILQELVKTDLVKCRLVAEERTSFIDQFNEQSSLILSIDPIDGTARYADGKNIYSLIVTLQQQGMPLYTFEHFPALNWTHRFIGQEHQVEGAPPKIELLRSTKGVMTYPYGDPEKTIPTEVQERITAQGLRLVKNKLLAHRVGAKTMLFSDLLDGYYIEEPSAYDGLTGLHYALVHGWDVHDHRTNLEPQQTDTGVRYPGFYYITRPKQKTAG